MDLVVLFFSVSYLTIVIRSAAVRQCIHRVDNACNYMIECEGQMSIKMPDCPKNLVYSKSKKVCVIKNGPDDDCSPKIDTITQQGCIKDKVDNRRCTFMKCVHGVYVSMPGCPSGYRHKKDGDFACVHTSDPDACVPTNGDLDSSPIITAKNLCDSGPCKNGGNCLPSLPPMESYICVCQNDFTGPNCEIGGNNVCSPSPCLNGGTCSPTPSGFICACPQNVNGYSFSGRVCEMKTQSLVQNPCSSDPCRNGGLCQATMTGGFQCVCTHLYTGQTCETNVFNLQTCTSSTCLNGGTCFVTSSGYNCACATTSDPSIVYTGKNCESMIAIDSSSCASGPCLNGGSCSGIGTAPGYACTCVTDPHGKSFAGLRCEEEITSSAITDMCQSSSTVMEADPEECQRFYNCSLFYDPIPKYFKQHLDECRYPKVFNKVNKQCDDFTNVDCGNRRVLLDGCEYSRNKPTSGHALPCTNIYPSCKNKADGHHEHPSKPNTPYYITCFQNRLMRESQCKIDSYGIVMLFHQGECRSRFEIPQSEGGFS